jgi:hypothetical protein
MLAGCITFRSGREPEPKPDLSIAQIEVLNDRPDLMLPAARQFGHFR